MKIRANFSLCFIPARMAIIKKQTKITGNASEDVEDRKFLCTVSGSIYWDSQHGH